MSMTGIWAEGLDMVVVVVFDEEMIANLVVVQGKLGMTLLPVYRSFRRAPLSSLPATFCATQHIL